MVSNTKEGSIFRHCFFFLPSNIFKKGVNKETFCFITYPTQLEWIPPPATVTDCAFLKDIKITGLEKILRVMIQPRPKCVKEMSCKYLYFLLLTKLVSIKTCQFMKYTFLEHLKCTQNCTEWCKICRSSR